MLTATRLTRARPRLQARSPGLQHLLRHHSNGSDKRKPDPSNRQPHHKPQNPPTVKPETRVHDKSQERSLYEQLFPEQRKEADADQDAARPVPRIQIERDRITPKNKFPFASSFTAENDVKPSEAARRLEQQMLREQQASGPVESVLVLRNATKNLLEEDFRRLTPHGRHIEGWKMQESDFIKVIPGRDIKTLERLNYYYLIFASALSAFAYQGHAIRLHRLVTQQTPQSILSPIAPPPGYTINGIDAHEAVEKFTLVPPNAFLDLRKLQDPLPPLIDSLVRNRGYPSLVNRPKKCPYEARLTMEGPKVGVSYLRHVFMLSGKERGLTWSGGEDTAPQIHEWDSEAQFDAPSPRASGRIVEKWRRQDENKKHTKSILDEPNDHRSEDAERSPEFANQRSHNKVYVLGFQTERAMQSFVRHWHRRPLEADRGRFSPMGGEDDLPPVLNVEILW